jgi:hypothetical protein
MFALGRGAVKVQLIKRVGPGRHSELLRRGAVVAGCLPGAELLTAQRAARARWACGPALYSRGGRSRGDCTFAGPAAAGHVLVSIALCCSWSHFWFLLGHILVGGGDVWGIWCGGIWARTHAIAAPTYRSRAFTCRGWFDFTHRLFLLSFVVRGHIWLFFGSYSGGGEGEGEGMYGAYGVVEYGHALTRLQPRPVARIYLPRMV